jgi:hypothetical protein
MKLQVATSRRPYRTCYAKFAQGFDYQFSLAAHSRRSNRRSLSCRGAHYTSGSDRLRPPSAAGRPHQITSSVTFCSQLTLLPSSASWMAICVIAVVGVAPCQCLCPGGHQITSPARISTIGSPSHCVHPQPAVTSKVCPSGCVCHAARAAGSKVTLAQETRDGAGATFNMSMRTEPVKYSAGPIVERWELGRLNSMTIYLLKIRGYGPAK